MIDYLVFVGPTPSLDTELLTLRNLLGVTLVRAAVGKGKRGTNSASISRATTALVQLAQEATDLRQPSRLSVWAYAPQSREMVDKLWESMGTFGWLELVPADLENKERPTRQYIEKRYPIVRECLHEISYQVSNLRRRSPFPLPLRNFTSRTLDDFKRCWYEGCSTAQINLEVERIANRFRRAHPWDKRGSKAGHPCGNLLFSPARNEACHGVPHPTGAGDRCFLLGRYRFGAALYPGFHYDVSAERGNLNGIFYDCQGRPRDLAPERREYINIFPNDHLLPERA